MELSPETQRKLLAEDKTFDECIALAVADEAATRESSSFHASSSTNDTAVNYVDKKEKGKKPNSSAYQRFSCGNSGHKRDDCKFRNAICHKCKKKGHIKAVCKSKTNFLQGEKEDDDVEMLVMSDNRARDGIFVPIKLKDKCTIQLDTCAFAVLSFVHRFINVHLQSEFTKLNVLLMYY